MDWTEDDLKTYVDTKLTNSKGQEILFLKVGRYWVVKHWNNNRKAIAKSKPILRCVDSTYLLSWLTRWEYEYR